MVTMTVVCTSRVVIRLLVVVVVEPAVDQGVVNADVLEVEGYMGGCVKVTLDGV